MERSRRLGVAMSFVVAMVLVAEPAFAVDSNGFDTDFVYALRARGDGGAIEKMDDAGSNLTTFLSSSSYRSLTFSDKPGAGAQLFAFRYASSVFTVEELNSSGAVVGSATSTQLGITLTNSDTGIVRWSRTRPDSVFVGMGNRVPAVGGVGRAMGYEIDLDLSTPTLKATYTGPENAVPTLSHIAIDEQDGAIYMISQNLNAIDGYADMVRMDTTYGDTNLYQQRICGKSFEDRYSLGVWFKPLQFIYRSSNPTDSTPTILVGTNLGDSSTVEEFYLDTATHAPDADGNLIRRGQRMTTGIGYGQEDEMTGTIWIGATGLRYINSADGKGVYGTVFYSDADSPSLLDSQGAGDSFAIGAVVPSPDSAYENVEYIEQMIVADGTAGGTVTWSVLQGAGSTSIDSDGLVSSGWTPSACNTGYTFEIKGYNAEGTDTELWIAEVNCDTPVIAVLPDVDTNGNKDDDTAVESREYVEQLILAQGATQQASPATPMTWSLATTPATSAVVDSNGRVDGWTPGVADIGDTTTFNVTAWNEYGTDTLSWNVVGATIPPVINAASLSAGTYDEAYENQPYSESLSVTAPPDASTLTWSLVVSPVPTTSTPAINASTGEVGWTPDSNDINTTFTLTASADNSGYYGGGSDTEVWPVFVDDFVPLNSDYLYVLDLYYHNGGVIVLDESDGTIIDTDLLNGANEAWRTLTVSGDGTSQAALYVGKQSGGEMAVFDGAGTEVDRQKLTEAPLSQLSVGELHMRYTPYSSLKDSIFVATKDVSGATGVLKVYQLDLGLSTVEATFTGPVLASDMTTIALDDTTGDLYVTGGYLDGGDVIKFDTSGGTASTYVTLVDNATFASTYPGLWNRPFGLAFRPFNPEDGTRVLQVSSVKNVGSERPVIELFIDLTAHPLDGNGDLECRGTVVTFTNGCGYAGAEDRVDGTMWWGSRGGPIVKGIDPDDAITAYGTVGVDVTNEAASPLPVGTGAPTLAAVSDPDYSHVCVDYVQRMVLTGGALPMTGWSVSTTPSTSAAIDSNGLITGFTPNTGDAGKTYTFEVKAWNAAGTATEDWIVELVGDNPAIAAVSPDPGTILYGTPYIEPMSLTAGPLNVTWAVTGTTDATGVSVGPGGFVTWTPGASDPPDSLRTIEISATDCRTNAGTESWQMRVDAEDPAITAVTPDPDYAFDGVPYVKQLSTSAGTAPITWSLTGNTTATGAVIDSSGKVTGWTPDASEIGTTITIEAVATNADTYPITGATSAAESWKVIVAEGFHSDYVYGARNGAGAGIQVIRESDNAIIRTNLIAAEEWVSITFTGTEVGNTRCFLYYDRTVGHTDNTVREIDALGRTVNSATLADLGAILSGDWGPVRWSTQYEDSLFVSTTGTYASAVWDMVYEIDLDLTTIKNTYRVSTGGNQAYFTDMAIDDTNGDIYLMNPGMAGTSADGQVHKFLSTTPNDTAMVIDGNEITGIDGNVMQMIAYRDAGSGASERTLLVGARNNSTIFEFYLDTATHAMDGNGNLAQKTTHTVETWIWHGQQAGITGTVWMGSTSGAPGDMNGLEIGDSVISLTGTAANWWDIDSPSASRCPNPDIGFDADNDDDVDLDDFAVFQRCYNTGVASPPALSATCKCMDKAAPANEIDDQDLAKFLLCASGPGVPASVSCDD